MGLEDPLEDAAHMASFSLGEVSTEDLTLQGGSLGKWVKSLHCSSEGVWHPYPSMVASSLVDDHFNFFFFLTIFILNLLVCPAS